MIWRVRFSDEAGKAAKSLDAQVRKRIKGYLAERVVGSGDPRSVGKSLRGGLAGLWRYRVGDYRVLCRILDGELLVLVVDVGHRSEVYGD